MKSIPFVLMLTWTCFSFAEPKIFNINSFKEQLDFPFNEQYNTTNIKCEDEMKFYRKMLLKIEKVINEYKTQNNSHKNIFQTNQVIALNYDHIYNTSEDNIKEVKKYLSKYRWNLCELMLSNREKCINAKNEINKYLKYMLQDFKSINNEIQYSSHQVSPKSCFVDLLKNPLNFLKSSRKTFEGQQEIKRYHCTIEKKKSL